MTFERHRAWPIRYPQNGHVARTRSAKDERARQVGFDALSQHLLSELGADGRRPGTVRAHEPRPRNVSAACRRARLRRTLVRTGDAEAIA